MLYAPIVEFFATFFLSLYFLLAREFCQEVSGNFDIKFD